MAWSYSGNPSSSSKDKVRFLIGDTDITDPQLSDEEVNAILADFPNVYSAAIQLVRGLIAKYARKVDKSVGDLSISYSKIGDSYRALLASLQSQAAVAGAVAPPYAGGISVSDKNAQDSDTDRVPPTFAIGMHDRKGE